MLMGLCWRWESSNIVHVVLAEIDAEVESRKFSDPPWGCGRWASDWNNENGYEYLQYNFSLPK